MRPGTVHLSIRSEGPAWSQSLTPKYPALTTPPMLDDTMSSIAESDDLVCICNARPPPIAAPRTSKIVTPTEFDALVAIELTKIQPIAVGLMHGGTVVERAIQDHLQKERFGRSGLPQSAAIDVMLQLALVAATPKSVFAEDLTLGEMCWSFHERYTRIRGVVRATGARDVGGPTSCVR